MESRIKHSLSKTHRKSLNLLRLPLWGIAAGLPLCLLPSCGSEAPPVSDAITNRDSIPVMVTHGVSKLISDSGIIQYKVITEEWQVFDRTRPEKQYFPKGIYLERYNKQFEVVLHLTADTAYCYDQNLWELRGRVFVHNAENGTTFTSEELFWDMKKHWMYSHLPMHLVTPDRDLRGNHFESNENLTKYKVWKTSGFGPMPESKKEEPDTTAQPATITVRSQQPAPRTTPPRD